MVPRSQWHSPRSSHSQLRPQDANRTVAGGGITAAGWQGQGRRSGQDQRGQALAGRQGPARRHGAGNHLLESRQQGGRQLHGQGDVHRAEVHEPQRSPASVRHRDRAATTWARRQQSYLYCAAYGNGNFIVRGFGPEPFQVNGRRGEPNDAVHKAAGKDSAGDAGNRGLGEGRQSRVRDQRRRSSAATTRPRSSRPAS